MYKKKQKIIIMKQEFEHDSMFEQLETVRSYILYNVLWNKMRQP